MQEGSASNPGNPAGSTMTLPATVSHIGMVTSFVEGELEKWDCPVKTSMQISMAVEEIFVNIASYAYPPEVADGKVWVKTEIHQQSITVTISDAGAPYDPLQKPDPDLSMDVEDRQHGGFGIFMVKNAMDDVRYERKDGHNILTIKKKILRA